MMIAHKRKCRLIFCSTLIAAMIMLTTGCASSRATARAHSYEADGVHVRQLRLRVAPSHTGSFEALMRRCVRAARTAKLPDAYDWLCYRESPGRYWLLQFSGTMDGFATPGGLEGFVEHVGRAESEAARAEIGAMRAKLEYETEWEIVFQRKADWSSVTEMSTAVHPKARMMERTIRPGKEAAFETALQDRTAFLIEHGYPLPIEGFALRRGLPGRAIQVVFATDWPSFHASDSFYAFVQSLDEAAQQDYAARKAALMETMASAEYYDGEIVKDLCYSAE